MKKEVLKEIFEWIKTIVFAALFAFIIIQFVRPTIVKGESMFSTLQDGDFLIINRISYKFKQPERGDIIVFKSDLPEDENQSSNIIKLAMGIDSTKKDLIKRVIGVAGDHIEIKNKKVYVNDKEIEEPYLNEQNRNNTDGNIDVVVPEGTVFVLGDNREISLDSRYDTVGFIQTSKILGKAFVRLYPFNKINLIGGVEYKGV